MAPHQRFALLAALLACACLNAAAAGDSQRRMLQSGALSADGWSNVTVVNRCAFPLALKAAYAVLPGIDDGRPCPGARPGGACATPWARLAPGQRAVLADLPDLLWSFAAYIPGSQPRHYLSRQTPEAYLAAADNFGSYCSVEKEDACVWWAVPPLEDDGSSGGLLELSCPEYDPQQPPEPEQPVEITVANACPEPVRIKFAYRLPETDAGAGCLIDKWYDDERRCVTDYQWLEPGEERWVAQAAAAYFEWGAQLAENTTHDLAQLAVGAFQGWNDTLACPEEDVYGGPYPCEWWAPSCHMCGANETLAAISPFTITCEGYRRAAPAKASLPRGNRT